jgi:hypothetical protein
MGAVWRRIGIPWFGAVFGAFVSLKDSNHDNTNVFYIGVTLLLLAYAGAGHD